MSFVGQPFVDTFEFSRARTATVRGPDGEVVEAPVDAPRLDHDDAGSPRGLLVEGRPDFSEPDVLRVKAGAWEARGGTVLHEYESPAGGIRRRAWYARTNPRSVVDACLGVKGHHRIIAYVPGHLPNRAGQVRWRDRFWSLGGALVAGGAGEVLAAVEQIPLIEG